MRLLVQKKVDNSCSVNLSLSGVNWKKIAGMNEMNTTNSGDLWHHIAKVKTKQTKKQQKNIPLLHNGKPKLKVV